MLHIFMFTKKVWVAVKSQSIVVAVDESHSTWFMSALLTLNSVTFVRSQGCAKLKNKSRELRGKRIEIKCISVPCLWRTRVVRALLIRKKKQMYYAGQIATVEVVLHIGCKAEIQNINLNGHDVRMQNDTGSSVTKISTKMRDNRFSNFEHEPAMDWSVWWRQNAVSWSSKVRDANRKTSKRWGCTYGIRDRIGIDRRRRDHSWSQSRRRLFLM